MLVNKKELADVFGITERSFTEYQKDSTFPIKEHGGRGRQNVYDTQQVYRWLETRAEGQGQETAKERLDRLRGDQAELAIAKEIGELVPAEDVQRDLDDVVSAIRSSVLFGNTKLKKELDTVYSIDVDVEVLNDHSREVLTDLSSLEIESEECDSGFAEAV